MKTDKIYIESINTFEYQAYKIRFWRKQKKGFSHTDNQREIFAHIKKCIYGADSNKIAEHCIKLKNVNAVEVKYSNNTGIVLYKNWP